MVVLNLPAPRVRSWARQSGREAAPTAHPLGGKKTAEPVGFELSIEPCGCSSGDAAVFRIPYLRGTEPHEADEHLAELWGFRGGFARQASAMWLTTSHITLFKTDV
jgi:hypothetical protein